MLTRMNEKQDVNSLVQMWKNLWRMCKTYVFPQVSQVLVFFDREKLEYFYACSGGYSLNMRSYVA